MLSYIYIHIFTCYEYKKKLGLNKESIKKHKFLVELSVNGGFNFN